MRIVVVTHYFPPEIGAPQARLSELAHHWAAADDDVTVVTGMPNQPTGHRHRRVISTAPGAAATLVALVPSPISHRRWRSVSTPRPRARLLQAADEVDCWPDRPVTNEDHG